VGVFKNYNPRVFKVSIIGFSRFCVCVCMCVFLAMGSLMVGITRSNIPSMIWYHNLPQNKILILKAPLGWAFVDQLRPWRRNTRGMPLRAKWDSHQTLSSSSRTQWPGFRGSRLEVLGLGSRYQDGDKVLTYMQQVMSRGCHTAALAEGALLRPTLMDEGNPSSAANPASCICLAPALSTQSLNSLMEASN